MEKLLLSVILLPTIVFANPYFPLREGSVAKFDYNFSVDSTREEVKATAQHGTMVSTNKGIEEKAGKSYFRFLTSYQGIPYMTKDAEIWRREENGNIYMLAENPLSKGNYYETLELPSDLSVGKEWSYNDGEESVRKVTATVSVRLPDGTSVNDCLEVTRTILKNPNLKDVKNITYYCRDTGDSGSLFLQPSPIGEYKTETKLAEYSPAK